MTEFLDSALGCCQTLSLLTKSKFLLVLVNVVRLANVSVTHSLDLRIV